MPFSFVHRVQFSETDMAGVVHFSNYFRWMEEVEHEFFRSAGLSVAMEHDGIEIGWPRVSASCQYFGPARFEDAIELVLHVTKIGDKSLTYEVEFRRGGEKIALGKITSACCHMGAEGMAAVPIPAEIRAKLASAT